MADLKHGRLFTERDVSRLIAEALIRQHSQPSVCKVDDLLEHVDPSELTFPEDEPLFLIRASDEHAVDVMCAIYNLGGADTEPWSRERYAELVHLQFAMADWRDANPDKIKVAESEPLRPECPTCGLLIATVMTVGRCGLKRPRVADEPCVLPSRPS